MGKGTGKKPPPIGIVKQGKAAITAYFDSLKKETLPLNEVKVLLVGDSAAGKTSLVNRLLKSFYRVSCKTNEGFDALVPALEKALSQVEMIGTTWATSWPRKSASLISTMTPR